MKCAEARQIGPKLWAEQSRTEIGAMLCHFLDCDECFHWATVESRKWPRESNVEIEINKLVREDPEIGPQLLAAVQRRQGERVGQRVRTRPKDEQATTTLDGGSASGAARLGEKAPDEGRRLPGLEAGR